MNLQNIASRRPSLRLPQEARERRLHRRVPWTTRARGLTEDGVEFTAQTVDICAGGIRIVVEQPLRVGETLVLYLDDIGRVEGSVIRPLSETEYAVVLSNPRRKREKIADQLTWLINRDRLNLVEERVAERRPGGGQVLVKFGQGMSVACAVVDISIFGAALRTNGPRPMLGVKVKVGERAGTCVRFFDGGFAVDFRQDPPVDAAN